MGQGGDRPPSERARIDGFRAERGRIGGHDGCGWIFP